jgi:DDE superfamily endonuclease
MEDVLEVYQRPHDPDRPVVCLDETTKQLIKETGVPVAAEPGQPARHDYEYERNGTANLFMLFAPLEGWPQVEVTDRHTALDYAHVLRDLSDRHFPAASEIILVQDNLSIRRIPDKPTLIEQVAAWQQDRNKNHTKADWQFTTADARIKLKRLYPAI